MSTTPTISVRSLGPNYDPLFGNGQANFLTDLDAVAQIIGTTLRLFEQEWWESLTTGTPVFQSILGPSQNVQANSAILQARIRSVPYVTGLSNVAASFDSTTRAFSFSCSVQTSFGTLQVSIPQPSSASIGV